MQFGETNHPNMALDKLEWIRKPHWPCMLRRGIPGRTSACPYHVNHQEHIAVKHRDRVLMALNHETPDRCPMQVSFTPEFADRLRAGLRMRGSTSHNPHGGGNSYELERALGQDLILTSVGWVNSY